LWRIHFPWPCLLFTISERYYGKPDGVRKKHILSGKKLGFLPPAILSRLENPDMALKSKIASAKIEKAEMQKLGWGDIRVISHTYDDWEIELFIPFDQVSDENLPEKLKQVKDLISKKYNIPSYALQYKTLIQKEVTEQGVYTHLRIKRLAIDKGKPKFFFQSGISPSGIPYNDMVCYADLYPFDEFERELTEARIYSLLASEKVVRGFIDNDAVRRAITILRETGKPLLGFKIAQGIFPEAGKDAEVEFYFHARPSNENADEYISSRKVARGDMLCSKFLPSEGEKEGKTVRGRVVPPRKGLDVVLDPGKNVRINLEQNKLFADTEGLVVVRRTERSFITPAGEKIVPAKITVRIDPLLVIEAKDEVVELTTKDSVEIHGNLKIGSRIISSGEVHIEGNVNKETTIYAADDVVISGSVSQGNISSDKSVIAQYNVSGGRISAAENVVVKGVANNATIIGRQVYVDKIKGGRIVAGKSLTANEVGSDERGMSATICLATQDFLRNKITENIAFLRSAKGNLEKLKNLFGEDIVKEVMPLNTQQMLLKHLSRLRREGIKFVPHNKINGYKQLLQSIEPLRRLIYEKELEDIRLNRQIRRSSKEKKLVIVKEKITSKTKVIIDEREMILEAQSGPLEISDKDLKEHK
jgi:uncharacterized protein (DUF342 family)